MAEQTLHLKTFGDKATEKIFAALPKAFQDRVLSTAARAGGSVIRTAARANLKANDSIRTELLHRSISLRVKKYSSGIIWAGVGADTSVTGRTERGGKIVPANYLHLVEFGTSKSKAKPFLRPAVDNNKTAIQNAVFAAAEKGLNREIAKFNQLTK